MTSKESPSSIFPPVGSSSQLQTAFLKCHAVQIFGFLRKSVVLDGILLRQTCEGVFS